MTDSTVAHLDRGSTELDEAISRASALWDDSRREATARRFLLPHGEAHDRLQAQLAAVLDASVQASAAAREADLATAAAWRERDQAQRLAAEVETRLAETRAATDAAARGGWAVDDVYVSALRLVEEANAIAP